MRKLGLIFLFLTMTLLTIAAAEIDARSPTDDPPLHPTMFLPFVTKPFTYPDPTLTETTISINTVDYERAFVPTTPDDTVYPYPRLDHGQVGPATLRTYQALVLENQFVALTILPELGGRLYHWQDKITGRQLLYANPIIKPTGWGYRGWWLATGGIEWAFPVDEHGLNEYRPWTYTSAWNAESRTLSVTVSDVESRTGMVVGATITLDADHSYMTLEPWARNETAVSHQYQLWLNAMIALNDNTTSDQTEFILPTGEIVVHSTGDGRLPDEHGVMSWPEYDGRDMSWYGNWDAYLGFFVPNIQDGFNGVYDHEVDQGIARIFTPGAPASTKLFGSAGLDPGIWTNDGSVYLEIWGGATPDFWTYATLNPGETVTWTETWYPVGGLGGFDYANETAALRLDNTGSGAEIGVLVTGRTTGTLTLFAGGTAVAEWHIDLHPGGSLRAVWERPSEVIGDLGLRLADGDGQTLAETGLLP